MSDRQRKPAPKPRAKAGGIVLPAGPAAPAPEPEAPAPLTRGAVILEPFTTGEWHGRPRYGCHLCAFDTLNRETMLAHIADEHAKEK